MFNFINLEWLRSDFSTLEKTLRFPKLLKQAFFLYIRRIFLVWFLMFAFLDFIFANGFIIWWGSIIGIITFELFTVNSWYKNKLLSNHIENFKKSMDLFSQWTADTNKSYTRDFIDTLTDYSAYSLVNFGYVSFIAWIWELKFMVLFKLLVKPCDIYYSDLLVGYENKSFEADQKLWELAQASNNADISDNLEIYLSMFGSKVIDVDLKNSTLQEHKEYVKVLLNLYKEANHPKDLMLSVQQSRDERLQKVLNNLRINKSIFQNLLKRTQDYIHAREDLRFYAFQYDYYIRQLILLYARNHNISESEVFDYRWEALATYAN